MPKHYSPYLMLIQWSGEDDAYIVTVPELPGCIAHGESYEEAVRQGQDTIESWIDAARLGSRCSCAAGVRGKRLTKYLQRRRR